MELLKITTTFWISLFVFLSSGLPSSSLQVRKHPSHHTQASGLQLSFSHALPRKLRFTEGVEDKRFRGLDSLSQRKRKEHISEKPYKKEKSTLARSEGAWEEWSEGSIENSRFFTMDYSHVRRRRPIHNKSLPVAP